jgi:hypothetical protein
MAPAPPPPMPPAPGVTPVDAPMPATAMPVMVMPPAPPPPGLSRRGASHQCNAGNADNAQSRCADGADRPHRVDDEHGRDGDGTDHAAAHAAPQSKRPGDYSRNKPAAGWNDILLSHEQSPPPQSHLQVALNCSSKEDAEIRGERNTGRAPANISRRPRGHGNKSASSKPRHLCGSTQAALTTGAILSSKYQHNEVNASQVGEVPEPRAPRCTTLQQTRRMEMAASRRNAPSVTGQSRCPATRSILLTQDEYQMNRPSEEWRMGLYGLDLG